MVFFRVFLLLVGALIGASSLVFIRISELDPSLVSSYRLLIAAFILSPVYFYQARKFPNEARSILKIAWIPGLALCLHFISWAYGARIASPANATLIVNMVPIVMPFLMHYVVRERINKAEIIATALAFFGALLLTINDLKMDRREFFGNLICFGSMFLVSLYLLSGRIFRRNSLWLYVVPVYFFGGFFSLMVAIFSGVSPTGISTKEIYLMLGLALLPTIVGHSIFNYSMRHLRGQVVTVINLTQVIWGVIYGYFFFNRIPTSVFYLSAVMIVGGCAVSIMKREVGAVHPVVEEETTKTEV